MQTENHLQCIIETIMTVSTRQYMQVVNENECNNNETPLYWEIALTALSHSSSGH